MTYQQTESSAAKLAFEHSPAPLLIVSTETHQVVDASQRGRELLIESDSDDVWWNRLAWIHEELKDLARATFESEDVRPIENITLQDCCGMQASYRITSTDLGENSLLTFTRREENKLDASLMEETFHGTELRVGENYFHYCAEAFCKAFGMDCAIIARLDKPSPDDAAEAMAKTVSYFQSTTGIMPNISYPLLNTPCWLTYKTSEPRCIPCNVQSIFPLDEDLVTMGAESYLGVPILDESGTVFGHLALLSSKPISEPTSTERIFLKIFAARSGAEFRRSDIERELREAKLKAESANQAKTQFLANMSHELRSPLNAVLGYAQLLSENASLDIENHTQAKNINRNGRHLLSLINDVLDMSRIELGQVDLHEERVVLTELHRDILAMFLPANSDVHFDLQIAPNLPKSIRADHAKIRQILTNLISNALKYARTGSLTYQVDLDRLPAEKLPLLCFSIIDQGEGIPPEEHESIFHPFERGSYTELSQFTGTGLGLSIARRFARAMGGDIILVSEVGKGSTFTFSIPLKEEPGSEISSPSESSPTPPSLCQGLVLTVDDNDASREIVRKVLERVGYRIIEARDGLEGLETCLREKPDLVLMDVRMPKMSGLEAARHINESLTSDTPPIIGLTGDLLDVKGSPREHEVFDLVIGKPFEFQVLIEAVAKMLSRKSN